MTLFLYFSMTMNGFIVIGFIPCIAPAGLLPDEDDEQKNREDEMWRVIWLMPALIGIIEILLIIFVFRYETVAYCMMEGRDEEGMLHLKRIYRKKNNEDPEPIESLIKDYYN